MDKLALATSSCFLAYFFLANFAGAQPALKSPSPLLRRDQPVENLTEMLINSEKRDLLLKRLDCPQLQTKSQILKHLDFCSRLSSQIPENDKKRYSDISSVVRHWLEFFDEKDSSFFIKDNLYVKIPNNLKLIENSPSDRQIKSSAERAYKEVSESFARSNLSFPKGFLFIWVFPDATSMNRYWPNSEGAGAVALGCRHILIPSYPSNQQGSSLLFPFEDILAHELVHIGVNAQLDYTHIDDLPKWFHEGFATYFVSKNTKYAARTITTAQYEEYFQYFNYIDRAFGREKLFNFVKKSVSERDVSAGLKSILQIPSEIELQVRVFAWTNKPPLDLPLLPIISIAAGLTIFIATGYRIIVQVRMIERLVGQNKKSAEELIQIGEVLEAAKIYEMTLIDFPKYRKSKEVRVELNRLMPEVKAEIQARYAGLIESHSDNQTIGDGALNAGYYYLEEAGIWLQDAIKHDKIGAKLSALDNYMKFLSRFYLTETMESLESSFSKAQFEEAKGRVEELIEVFLNYPSPRPSPSRARKTYG